MCGGLGARWRGVEFGALAQLYSAPAGSISEAMDEPKETRVLTPEAHRALAEAAKRRMRTEKPAPESGGPPGPEPTRYGDWERKGIAVDF